MSHERGMYGSHAEYYDKIYHFKHYDKEAARLREILLDEGIADGSRVLEAACGTGSYLTHLQNRYAVSGFDINPSMLVLARQKVPKAALFTADMADFSVAQPVDALLCLFSSIGYVFPRERLIQAAGCFAAAVHSGGVLIIEPWLPPQAFRPGHLTMQTYDSDDLKLCRSVISQQRGELAVVNFHWLALRKGAAEPEHFVDCHELWLCPHELLVDTFRDAGFDCRLEANGLTPNRGLLIGKRR